MAGHSKWANIKHKKARSDAKKGKIFSKLVKEIMVAAKMGGSDPASNPRLRAAIDRAKSENLPGENIERAIKKGAGELGDVNYEEGVYEGYAPGGVAVLVAFMTDNRNRTASEVRHVFSKAGGRLGESGSVAWMFDHRGLITFDIESVSEERLMEAALEAGADDVVRNDEDGVFEVYTSPSDFHDVKKAFDEMGLEYTMAELSMIPKNTVRVEGKTADQVLRLLDDLEDLDDVQNVYANFDIPPEALDRAV
ncbi:MAG TPA: YebC/PmpR family DNA-binding transcriptional regulator [Deltaproteobacteria bacterium]|nr:YebC/PmpR family DNA-binding transcriptional regulator [Deltaproteobacteria bacterium]